MKNLEKNTAKKDRRIISLKEKFLIKTVEEDNSLSVDKMFSESSYSNFIKTFEKMEDLVRKTNKAMVIQNYNAIDEEISDKLSELKYEKVFEEENNFKTNQEKLEKNIDTFLDFLEENENDIYSTSFELNREKLTKQYKSEKEFNKTLDLIKDVDKDFCFSIVKHDNDTEFKVVTENKEFISNDYKELKKQLLDEVKESIKGNKSLENKIKEKYDDEYLKNDYDLSIKEDFKFSYISKGYEVETHIVVDKGNEKFELSGVETDKNIAEINRILTMEDYIETYNSGREKNTGLQYSREKEKVIFSETPKFYQKMEYLEKENQLDYSKLNFMKEQETFEDTLGDIKANIFFELDTDTNIKDFVKEKGDYLFENRILNNKNIDNYLEDRVKKQDESFKDELTLITINGKDRIKEFANENNFNEEEYKQNIKEYLKIKKSNSMEEVNEFVDKVVSTNEKNGKQRNNFFVLNSKYSNEETGTIQLENKFIKDRIALMLNEEEPDFFKNKSNFKEIEVEKTNRTDVEVKLNPNDKVLKLIEKDLQNYNINISDEKLSDTLKNFNANKYENCYERDFNKKYNLTKENFKEVEVEDKFKEKEDFGIKF